MIKKLFSNTLIYGLAPFIPKIASFFSLPIITKDLSDTDFGIFGVITAYVTAISCFSLLGFRVVFMNAYYHNPGLYKWQWRQMYGFLILWMIIFSLFLSTIIYYTCPNEAFENIKMIILSNVLPIVLFGPTGEIGQLFYQLNQKSYPIAFRSIFFGFLTVGLNLLFISHFKMHYMGWFYSLCIVTILNNLSYWYVLNVKEKITPIFNFKFKVIRKSLQVGLPTIPHFYSSYLVNGFERILMNKYSISMENIGKYNMANTFAGYANNFSNALAFALSPILMSLYKNEQYRVAKQLLFFLEGIFISGTFLLSIWTKEMFYLLIRNDTLKNTYPLAIVLIMSLNYRPIYFGVISLLSYKEKTSAIWKITLSGGIVALVLNLFLIPIIGYQAVIYSTFIAYAVWGILGFFLKSFTTVNNEKYYPIRWVLLYSGLTILAYFIVEYPLIIKLMISIVIVIPIFIVLFKYSKKLT